MDHERLIVGVAAALAGCALIVTAVALLTGAFAVLAVAVALAAAAYFMWYQASGRLAARIYAQVERQAAANAGQEAADGRGGFGAGPRGEWTPPRDGQTAQQQWRQSRGGGRRQGTGQSQRGRRVETADDGLSAAEARRLLDVGADADAEQIKAAYREKVKDVHPDTDGGDEEAFKRVNKAYERLS
ncbi:MAG: J domain-containing protein [Haloarculaceae archaeon]